MKKLKKWQRVELFLNKLINKKDYTIDDLADLNHKDILNNPELEGIGERTISNCMNAFKAENGVKRQKRRANKKRAVKQYLLEIFKERGLSNEDIVNLKYSDIKSDDKLTDMSKTTVSNALSGIKKSFENETFESTVLDYLESNTVKNNQTPPIENTPPENRYSKQSNQQSEKINAVIFNDEELGIIREMIDQFDQHFLKTYMIKRHELEEIKEALEFFGININRLLLKYKKDIRQSQVLKMDFMKNLGHQSNRLFVESA